jgi:hypothetical protein
MLNGFLTGFFALLGIAVAALAIFFLALTVLALSALGLRTGRWLLAMRSQKPGVPRHVHIYEGGSSPETPEPVATPGVTPFGANDENSDAPEGEPEVNVDGGYVRVRMPPNAEAAARKAVRETGLTGAPAEQLFRAIVQGIARARANGEKHGVIAVQMEQVELRNVGMPVARFPMKKKPDDGLPS